MSNLKNKSFSKRHIRRIIANTTSIDIAGSSGSIIGQSDTTNNVIEDYLDLQAYPHDIVENIEDTNIPFVENKNCNELHRNIVNIRDDDNESFNSDAVNVNINDECNENFKHAIAAWIVSYNIPHNACNALLKVLHEHTSCKFPIDTRTLLKTPRKSNVIQLDKGEYFYLGLHDIIKQMLLKSNDKHIDLLINIDGLPLAKSSHASLWPILCSNTKDNTVYLVGAYFGYAKPNNCNSYLQPLVNDLITLINEGFSYVNNVIKIRLFNLICDAPAKSFVLCVKGHTGFYSCTKCVIKGKYLNGRICFPITTQPYPLRKDKLFAINAYKDFQTGFSIFNNIPQFLPITNTPLDYLHLVCLGVVKKLILLWTKGPLTVRLNLRSINKISHLLMLLANSTPSEFPRKPRSLNDIKLWKVVELRNFLLYTGPVVLRYILNKDIYYHFITLHVAITILIRPNLCYENFINYAEALLSNFVTSFAILYGEQYISHNIHNLLHLSADVRRFGPLDNFSAFRFENYMTDIKKRLRKHEKPLQQLLNRYKEMENIDPLLLKHNYNKKQSYVCKYLHKNGPLCGNYNVKSQYFQISNEMFTINCKSCSNNCCILKNDICILVLNIIEDSNKDIFLISKKLKYVKELYEMPCKSSQFNIKVMATQSDDIFSYPITDVLYKAWKISYGNKSNTFAIIPLNHGV